MTIVSRKILFILTLIGLLAAAAMPVQAGSVNKSVRIDAGTTVDGASSVNGSITVGEGAIVDGELSTVNGSIRIHDDATVQGASTVNGTIRVSAGVRADDLDTVNGSIRVAENVVIGGHVEAVNGAIDLGQGTTVAHHVGNVNGNIELVGATIEGNLTTVSGDVALTDAATISGDLIVERPSRWSWGKRDRKPEIVIGPGSRVLGTIRLEHEVDLYVSESAQVGGVEGELRLDDAVRFSGDRP